MFEFFLFIAAISTNTTIKTDSILHFIINNNDYLEIDATGRTGFIQIHSHFFFGEMSASYIHNDEKYDYKPRAGDRIMVKDSRIIIHYFDARASAKIAVWLLPNDFCNERSIHSRNQRLASIFASGIAIPRDICYFLDFEKDVNHKFNISNNNEAQIQVIYPKNNSIVIANATSLANNPIPSIFLVRIKSTGSFDAELNFSIERSFADWTDTESNFSCWPPSLCNPDSFSLYNLTTDRSVAMWIWTIMFGFIGIGFAVIIYFMLSDNDQPNGTMGEPLKTIQNTNN